MSALTDLARGKECQVRLPCCNGNPETTVPAHFRLADTCGTGLKPDDWQVAWACSACHAECDRRTRLYDIDFVRLAHAEGMVRTQYRIVRDYTATWINYFKSRFLNRRGAA